MGVTVGKITSLLEVEDRRSGNQQNKKENNRKSTTGKTTGEENNRKPTTGNITGITKGKQQGTSLGAFNRGITPLGTFSRGITSLGIVNRESYNRRHQMEQEAITDKHQHITLSRN